MTMIAVLIRHKTRPGKRDEVRAVWERHMRPAIDRHPGHEAYFYCFDKTDADSIIAFQQYTSSEASESFLQSEAYAAYAREVEPLLTGPPEVTPLAPVWIKGPG